MDLVFCRDGVNFHPALLSGAVGLMVDFCQFPDAAFGRVDVHCRIPGAQMGAARHTECAHPRCGAGFQEHPGAPALIVAAPIMHSLPLVSHISPDSIIAWRADGAVTLRQFLAEVGELAALLPAGSHLLNLCGDRYRFSVGLAAAIVSGKVSLLPPAHPPEIVRQIKVLAPDVFCLTDSDPCTVDLPQLRYPAMGASPPGAFAIPQIEATQRIAVGFTSGSTGTPQPHPKTWGALVSSVQAEALRLGLVGARRAVPLPCTLVGTVPPQHMYGFESTLLMAWHSGNALSHARPFYPADICRALAAVPAPRVLVSSPVHLR